MNSSTSRGCDAGHVSSRKAGTRAKLGLYFNTLVVMLHGLLIYHYENGLYNDTAGTYLGARLFALDQADCSNRMYPTEQCMKGG